MNIKGSITALVTPFKNGVVDAQAYQDFIEWQIASGTNGLVPVGTTGEASTLSETEHKQVITLCVEAASGRVPVIAGAGSNDTRVSVELAQHAKDLGADAALVVTPYYNKPNQEGLYQHFKTIADSVDIPIIVYNIPGRSVIDINNDTMELLASLPTVVGCKDATGDITRVSAMIERCGEDFIQLSGDDASALGYRAHGGHGAISVGSNIAPAAYAAMQAACSQGDFVGARSIHSRLDRLHKDLFLDPSPAPAKYGLNLMGRMSADVRLPITPCSDATKAAVRAAMSKAGVDWAGVEF